GTHAPGRGEPPREENQGRGDHHGYVADVPALRDGEHGEDEPREHREGGARWIRNEGSPRKLGAEQDHAEGHERIDQRKRKSRRLVEIAGNDGKPGKSLGIDGKQRRKKRERDVEEVRNQTERR